MFTQLSDSTKAILFYLIAFTLSTLVAILIVALDAPNAIGYIMFTPLAAVLIMLLVLTRDGYSKAGWQDLGLLRAGWRGWPMALLLPFALLASSYMIAYLLGVTTWQWPAVATIGDYALNLVAALVIGSLFALGEEIGWRGYLLPHMLGMGRGRASLLNGLLHGVWHLPLILLTPFYHGVGNRLIVVPLFLLTLTVGGVFYSYLRLANDSVWPAAVAHGAFNTFWGALAQMAVPTSLLWMEYLSGESGVITLVLAAIAVTILFRRLPPENVTHTIPKPLHIPAA